VGRAANPNLLLMSSQIVGVLAAATQGDANADSLQTGAWVAQNATQYNFMGHQELDNLEAEARACPAKGNCEAVKEKFRLQSVVDDDSLAALCNGSPDQCLQLFGDLLHDRDSLQERLAHMALDDSIPSMFKEDLHRYQLQNTSAITTLTKVQTELSLLDRGISSDDAAWYSHLLAAIGGDLSTKGTGKIVDGVATNIHPGQQGKHIPGNNNFIPGRSSINSDIDPQKLLDGVHNGSYPVVGAGSRGQPIVDFGRPIGVDGATGLPTNFGTIHSGKAGAHIVPTNPTTVGGGS